MTLEAAIFDLDGTLLDTLADIGYTMNQALIERGLPVHPVEKYRAFIGEGPKRLAFRVLPEERRTEDAITDILEAYLSAYEKNFDRSTRMYDGIAGMLDELVRRGVRLAVLSNKRHDLTVKCVNHFLSRWPFEKVLGLRDVVPRKPDPAGALEIADAFSLSPEKFAYLGDSGTDMKTARAAGMFAIGVTWGTHTKSELVEAGADAAVDHPAEILDDLASLGKRMESTKF